MFNLIKYDFKSKSKVLLSLMALFIIENIYVVTNTNKNFNTNDKFFINMIFMVLIFVSFSFLLNLVSFKNDLSPKPGYMIFMANVSRKEYVLTKIFTFFIESFFIGTFAVMVFLLEIKHLNMNLSLYSFIEDLQTVDSSLLIVQGFKLIFYLSLQYLTLITIFMLAIVIRNFLLKNVKFKGVITFIFANVLFFLRSYLYKFLNLSFYKGFNIKMNTFSNVDNYIIVVDILYLFIIIYALIYLMEKKLDI